eukprot:8327369-Ditylum_brightwellii.AAC.1
MLQDSYARMNAPYNLSDPIEDWFEQINAAQDLATANGTGYKKAQIASIMHVVIGAEDQLMSRYGLTFKSILQKHTTSSMSFKQWHSMLVLPQIT